MVPSEPVGPMPMLKTRFPGNYRVSAADRSTNPRALPNQNPARPSEANSK